MAIPNISDYFRSQQQHRQALNEQARQFNEAKAQKDQQFYTNMFAAPLMGMGTQSLGKFIEQKMPLAQAQIAKIDADTGLTKAQTEGLSGTNTEQQLGRGTRRAIDLFEGASDVPVPAPQKAPVPTSGGMDLIPEEEKKGMGMRGYFGGIQPFGRA